MIDWIYQLLMSTLGSTFGLIAWTLLKIVVITGPLMGCVAYLTYAERKVIAAMQDRNGPNVVGPLGLLQPIADAIKLMFKEVLLPTKSSKALFAIAPMLTILPALAVWAVVPFSPELVLANIDASLLYVMAVASVGVYGIIIAGWASNSKYSLLGAMRSAAQVVSYELAMGFALVGVILVAGSLNLVQIVSQQGTGIMGGSILSWNWLPLFPLFIVYLISGVAETNRAPFDVAEGESEIVAGHHVEYSGMAFAIFFLAEYANMILIAILTSILFLGGWLSPLGAGIAEHYLPKGLQWLGANSFIWLAAKVAFVLFLFLWFRATFPRYRYDQLMRLGWKVFLPITIVWIMVVALALLLF